MTTVKDIEQLFKSNYRTLLILANRLVHDEDEARDIVHDVFAKLLTEDQREVTPAYLANGVRYACLNLIRNRSVRERFKNLYALDTSELSDDEWPDETTINMLNEIVDGRLTEQCRRVVKLRFGSRLSYRETAEELGISETAVYKHLRHALNVIRQTLNEK
ncbi:MAG: sigma-70 family RNA polymerase sigma factor [Muribaculaceae bacterium]|nr:sigma-70 family RNA polymerase sigma factor [Muribaculaceae bacterium]